ncbi:MAG: uroporphyrinogen-III C-methyltransferase [Helicobacteraceae bacterium]|nr:uroporphyrinogen-III C-methyltransferase [Helicobacteraceae bacterium]
MTPKKVLLIGAGVVAEQKHRVLNSLKWEVSIVAKEILSPYFSDFSVILREFSFEILSDYEVVIDASGDAALGAELWRRKREFGYLLNVVDNPKFCDFYFGALARFGEVSVLVSTNGASPLLAQSIRDKIARILPKNITNLADKLMWNRKRELPSLTQREAIKKECKRALGKVFIIGCGPNSLELLTLKALECLHLIDIALVDNLVGAEILALLKELEVPCISVAKEKGKHSVSQDEINSLMLKYAQEGKSVGRLKGGDPLIFGRLFEELSFLQNHGVEAEVISGISSALNGALSSGILPTIRGVSSGVLIVSAHLRESMFNAKWLEILKGGDYTLIVLMAYSFASKIVKTAKELGIPLAIPAAFVSKVNFKEQKCVIGTLGSLEKMASMCEKPAILIIGKSVESCVNLVSVGEKIIINAES